MQSGLSLFSRGRFPAFNCTPCSEALLMMQSCQLPPAVVSSGNKGLYKVVPLLLHPELTALCGFENTSSKTFLYNVVKFESHPQPLFRRKGKSGSPQHLSICYIQTVSLRKRMVGVCFRSYVTWSCYTSTRKERTQSKKRR